MRAAIPGFPGYWVTDIGAVYSSRPEPLRPWLSAGYATVGLRRDGRTYRIHVHRLVLMAFIGLPPDGMDGCHRNGDRADNRLVNLYWGTRSQNIRDQVTHGVHNNARKTHCPQGHQYTEANTYALRGGRRQCKECTRSASAARYARKKESA